MTVGHLSREHHVKKKVQKLRKRKKLIVQKRKAQPKEEAHDA